MIERYSCPEISDIWTDNNKFLLWTTIELAFLKRLKGEEPTFKPTVFPDEWVQEIHDIELKTRHDTAAFVEWLEKKTHNRFVHFGLTSSDVIDTAFSLQIQQTNEALITLLGQACKPLLDLAHKYAQTQITGRTHGQAAEPLSLYNKFLAYHDALQFHRPLGPYYGKLSGSVGDYKYFTREVEKDTLEDLGLRHCPAQDGQVIHRTVYAQHMNSWALLASTVAKIATDIRLLAQTEIGEVQEGFNKGQVGSSSMPQKHNPILAENLCGLARVVRGYQTTAMQNIELWNERDISHSSAERIIYPDASTALGFMLKRLAGLLTTLQVNKDRIKHNLDKQAQAMSSQAEMLQLIESGCSRSEAHAKMRNKGV